MVNLFATWCPPCIGEIPYLNDLQKKYEKELLVVGILTHDDIIQDELETFMAKNQINYFISNGTENDAFATLLASTLDLPKNFSIPLTVIYVEGKYFTHYEGSVPVEMIEYDIQQAKKQLKAR
jgi:thiol-disulfide isomerase/thioredoxin